MLSDYLQPRPQPPDENIPFSAFPIYTGPTTPVFSTDDQGNLPSESEFLILRILFAFLILPRLLRCEKRVSFHLQHVWARKQLLPMPMCVLVACVVVHVRVFVCVDDYIVVHESPHVQK